MTRRIFYVFEEPGMALLAELHIAILGNAPIKGVNAQTGEISEKGMTTHWAEPMERLDGKWVFPRPSDELLATVSQEQIEQFNKLFPYTFEEYDNTWFPTEEDN